MARFFGWFFFFISLGSLLAVTVLVYVQDNVGRRWGYGACVVAILAGLGVFLAGTPRYRFKKLAGSPLTQIAAVTAAAWRKRALPLPSDPAMLYDLDDAAAAGEDVKGKRKLPHSKQCRFLDQAAIVEVELEPSSGKKKKWAVCTVTEVEEVKQVRIFVGLFLSILAMVVAGLTERHRLSASTAGVQLSVFLIVPQFLLVGAGEAFTYIGQLDFFLCECPRDMKTMSTGLFLTTLSLGFFLSSGLVSIVHAVTTSDGRRPWLANDIDKGRLDYFYWLLGAISTANLGIFIAAAKGYVYKEKRLADAGFIELHVEEVIVHA
ncbi:unnamed protein product [Triticum turgidum subsp. durum]|uniref:Uncharacterized protein n=1 Tax=Triticum turgidum subsp. durum TaxID=4567 RepID=A0A9R0TCU6_TRITD|nr:unnamed protein product [Triticum turgidum subsp. durum]